MSHEPCTNGITYAAMTQTNAHMYTKICLYNELLLVSANHTAIIRDIK